MDDSAKKPSRDRFERARQIYKDYLARVNEGDAEGFDELLARYPDDRYHLESFRELSDQTKTGTGDHDAKIDSPTVPSSDPDAASQPEPEPRSGTRVGEYVLESPLGRGGQGAVWLGRHASLGKRVAIKFADRHDARSLREGRLTAQLQHPNIVRCETDGLRPRGSFSRS